jgi:hypothetical protein
MIKKLAKRWEDEGAGAPAEDAPLFNLEEIHERRILSWSPEPEEADDEQEVAPPPPAPPAPAPQPVALTVAPEPPVEHVAPRVAAPAAAPRVVAPAAPPRAPVPVEESPTEAAEPATKRPRGRPRGRPRRQVHFHVDPDEELLLLAAARKFGSQQKGIVAGLQALHDIELVRDEVERLTAECEHQRKLLERAESIFSR